MELKSPKDIKALAKACRQAGITSFEGFGVKFNLSAQAPKTIRRAKAETAPMDEFEKAVVKAKAERPQTATGGVPEAKTPTEQDLLFWSSGDGPNPDMSEEGPTS